VFIIFLSFCILQCAIFQQTVVQKQLEWRDRQKQKKPERNNNQLYNYYFATTSQELGRAIVAGRIKIKFRESTFPAGKIRNIHGYPGSGVSNEQTYLSTK